MKPDILRISVLSTIITLILLAGCGENYSPKPRGYFRISFPEKKYVLLDSIYPYKFEYPSYARIVKDEARDAEPFWINIYYPSMKGIIHLSYKKINGNFSTIEEDSRGLAYKHTIKADAINEKLYFRPEKKVYGIYYEIKGNAASSVQFFVTDSTEHFLRGSLYFSVRPNKDSLAPVIDFVSKDIQHLMETFEWK